MDGRGLIRERSFWAGLIGVLAGLALGGVLYLLLRPPREAPLILEPPPTPTDVVVYVDGAVRKPGVYALPPGSRLQDALVRAGGPLPNADLRGLNLAQPLQDGQRIYVPWPNEAPPTEVTPPPTPIVPEGFTFTRVDLNTATLEDLIQLPGIGPSLAERILEYRETHGPFHSVEDLLNVKGIGPAKLEQLRPYITVTPPNE